MKQQANRNIHLVLFIVIIWSSYAVWEWQVWAWAARNNIGGPIIRVDLLFLIPILAVTTVYVLYLLYKNSKK